MNVDEHRCWCGNEIAFTGFYPVNADGIEVEPDADWGGMYKCADCGQLSIVSNNRVFVVFDPDTVAKQFARVAMYECVGGALIDGKELDTLAANVEIRMGEWMQYGAPDERATIENDDADDM